MPDLFVLVTCGTEPFVALLRIVDNHSATRSATLTKLTFILPFNYRFPFVVNKAYLTPKVTVAEVTRNSRSRRYTRRTSRYIPVRKFVPRYIYSLNFNPHKRIV
jgi:hypothetical protein